MLKCYNPEMYKNTYVALLSFRHWGSLEDWCVGV